GLRAAASARKGSLLQRRHPRPCQGWWLCLSDLWFPSSSSSSIHQNKIIQSKSNQIKSNQIKSNQIKSNQIKSNQIKSNQIKSKSKSNPIKSGVFSSFQSDQTSNCQVSRRL